MATSASQIHSSFFRNPAFSLTFGPSLSVFSVTLTLRRRALPQLVVVPSAANLDAKPMVFFSKNLGEPEINILKQIANVDCSYNLSLEELCTKISLCDALIIRSETKVTRKVFESSSGRLKVVGIAGVGIDNVDLARATEFRCLVVNALTSNTVAAAKHGTAHIRWSMSHPDPDIRPE